MSANPLSRSCVQAAAFALMCLAGGASAQTPPDAGRILEENRPPPRPALPVQTAPRVVEPPARPAVTMAEGTTVTVSDFRIVGARSYPAAQLAELTRPFLGRKLDINGLNEAAGAITRFYQSAGHLLTYAYLPAQRVADGVIEIAVLEGRLEGVQIVAAQDVRLRDEVIEAHTDGLTEKPPLLQPDVERRLLLLNDIPGVAARAAFTPGASTGAAEMVVSVAEDEPIDVRAEFNNHGSKSTGEYRGGLSVQLRDLSGWGDATLARLLVSNRGGLVLGSINSSLPLGGNGWRLGASVSHLTYELGGAFKATGASGNADTLGMDLGYALLRSLDSNVSLKAGYEFRRLLDQKLAILGLDPSADNPKRNQVLELSLAFDNRDAWGGLTAGSLAASTGQLEILNDTLAAEDASGLHTARTYRKLVAQLARQQAISGPVSVYLRLAGQATGGNLDSSEKFGLAGPGVVRAYAPGEAAVDEGIFGSLELRYMQEYVGGSVVWSVFHDRGQGLVNRRPRDADLNGNHPRLTGSGLGVQWNGGDLALAASLAWRGSHAPTAEGGDPRPRLYLQMTVTP